MLGEILEGAFFSFDVFSGRVSRTIFRSLFGLLGVTLSAIGVHHVLTGGIEGISYHFKFMAALNFACLGSFCLFNVVLLRPYRWPGRLFVLSIVLLFLVRVVYGP